MLNSWKELQNFSDRDVATDTCNVTVLESQSHESDRDVEQLESGQSCKTSASDRSNC